MSRAVYLHSFAKYLPPRQVTNTDLMAKMETSDEWIRQRSGIESRYWVDEGVGTSDLAVESARQTLKGKIPEVIIGATLSPDYDFPGIGVLIQHKLGLPPLPAYDIRQQCCGFIYGVEMASALIRSGSYHSALLVGAEVHSTGLDISTRGRDIAVLFGDGAGSCLVEAGDSAPSTEVCFRVVATELHSDGSGAEDLWCQYPSSRSPRSAITPADLAAGMLFPKMNGRKVFESAVKKMTEVSLALLAKEGLSPKELAYLVPHQANLRINMMVADHLGLRSDQCFNTIQHYGNTTAATIPITMTDLIAERTLSPGDKLLMTAFGSGFTWGAALVEVV